MYGEVSIDAETQEFRKNPPAFITVDIRRYQELEDDSAKLYALEAAGVDNWVGYDDAVATLDDGED